MKRFVYLLFISQALCHMALAASPVRTTYESSWEQRMVEGRELERSGDYTRAESILNAAVLQARNSTERARTLAALGSVYQDLGRSIDAEIVYKRALKFDPESTEAMSNLSSLYFEAGRYAKAEHLLRLCLHQPLAALEMARQIGNQAVLFQAEHEYSKAETKYAQAVALFEANQGAGTPEMAYVLHNLGLLRMELGKAEEAVRYEQRAVAIWAETFGTQHPIYAEGLAQLALIYAATGNRAEAESLWARALPVLESKLGNAHPTYLRFAAAYARLQGR